MAYLIFPNQLFELKYFMDDVTPTPKEIHILEDPVFFGFRNQKLNFNKLKLVLHRGSMKYYYDYLNEHIKNDKNSKHKNIKIHYHQFDSLIENPEQDKKYKPKYSSILGIIKKTGLEKEIYTFDLNDHYLESVINKAFPSIKYVNNPNFVVSKDKLDDYYNQNKSKKTIVQGHFYNWIKEQDLIKELPKRKDLIEKAKEKLIEEATAQIKEKLIPPIQEQILQLLQLQMCK
jgi:deoxyribodipyrimidine photolyase-related protein